MKGLKSVMVRNIPIGCFVVGLTKLDGSFANSQFNLSGYEIRARRDRDKRGSDLIEFVSQGFISRRLKEYEPIIGEYIFSEFIISNNKWTCFNILGLR